MSQEEISRMFLYARTHELPWDEWESDRPILDIDEEELRAFVSRGNACGRIEEPFASVEATLEGLGLLRGDHLTNAAEVLFCTSRDVELKMGILATHARTSFLENPMACGRSSLNITSLVPISLSKVVNTLPALKR